MAKTKKLEDQFKRNHYAEWGVAGEAHIADWYARLHSCALLEVPKMIHKDIEWISGSPDRLICETAEENTLKRYTEPLTGKSVLGRGLEIKTARADHDVKWRRAGMRSKYLPETAEEPYRIETFRQMMDEKACPPNYYVQCQWYMHLLCFDEWDLVVKLDSADYREYRVMRDDGFLSHLVGECQEFWEKNVMADVPPKMDWSKNYYVRHTLEHPEPTEEMIEGTRVDDALAADLRFYRRRVADLVDEKKELSATIKRSQGMLHKIKTELDEASKAKQELENEFRKRVGGALGVHTGEGTIKFHKVEGYARRIRIDWSKD